MKCTSCNEEVEPNNNSKLYFAAFEALLNGEPIPYPDGKLRPYHPQAHYLNWDLDHPITLFREEHIVLGDPVQSIKNVMVHHSRGRGRHIYAPEGCEGSLVVLEHIEEGNWEWREPIPMSERHRDLALKALEIVKELKNS